LENIEHIIKDCIKGKSYAQRAFYKHFQRKMYRICLRYSNSYPEAEDVAQEGFVKIFKNLNQYKNTGSIEAWMTKIMINTALEKFKKKSLLYIAEDISEIELTENYEDIIEKISAKDIISIIQELSPQYKMVFNMYEIDGYTHTEIAKLLGISESTSRSNLLRAKVILQKKLIKHFHHIKEKNI